ncbi:trimeric intracellular cation channel family protein [Chitinophaga deserti]|uniref:trimeric intracellular cation channel family protein n=1 Tax=Chitinophaga deserti TaxID=2164099 RepID=UPI000D6CB172|nr:trimeric intracellular cation channel family protein [Chitinophaga deserti]
MIYWLDLIGTFVFAISGALAAWDKKMYHDIFGVSFTAFVTSIGGGTMRDLILGTRPVWVNDSRYVIAIILGVLVTLLFRRRLLQYRRSIFLFDTLGIGFYTVIGLQKALAFGVHPWAAVILGMISAIFGGVIRDMMVNEIPLIFSRQIYATACLAGAALYIGLSHLGVDQEWNMIASIILVITIRLTALRKGWSLPYLEKK